MSRILVSLVSKQTVPNVLFIKEMKEIDKYLFITTEKMEEDHKRETIINACKDSVKNNSSYIIAKEDSIIDLQDKLKDYTDAETADDDVFIVNLTGGTKLMSIGAFEIFRKKESQIFYIPLGKNKYRKISPDVKLREFELEYRFTLDGYLRANGIDIIHKVPDVRFDIEITKKFFSLFENDLMIHHLPLLRILKERIQSGIENIRRNQ